MCKNLKLYKNETKNLGVSNSSIVGWGLFAKEDLKKDDLIGEYIGEIVDMDDLNDRSEYMDLENATYMFTLNDEYTVDSKCMGNILRFANHSKSKANAYTKILFANGNHRICLFSNASIKKHDEIFFDYDGQNILCDKYEWINDQKKTEHKRRINKNMKANKNVKSIYIGQKRGRKDKEDDFGKSEEMDIKMKMRIEKALDGIRASYSAEDNNNKKDEQKEDLVVSKNLLKKIFSDFRTKNNMN